MIDLNFHPFPELRSERLLLRSLRKDDDEDIFFFRSDSRILEFIDMPPATSIDEAQAFIDKINIAVENGISIYWVISLPDENKFIGTICLWNISIENSSGEIGYVLHPDYQGKGIMHEAVIKVLEFGFKKMKLKSIEANLSPKNLKSVKVLEKNNFIRKKPVSTLNTIQYSLNNPFF